MDHHKSMYKDQRFDAPRQHIIKNRKLHEDSRAKHRRDRFQHSRNVSLSPDRRIKEQVIPIETQNKENMNEDNPNTTRLAKIVCNATSPKDFTKKEEFIKRFIKWKEAKKNTLKSEKKKPFIVSCGSSSWQTTTSSSFVPKGHHKGFQPPAGLKNTIQMKKVDDNKDKVKDKGRQSIYTLVPTPKKHRTQKPNNPFPVTRKELSTKFSNSNKLQNGSMALVKSASKPKTLNNISSKTPGRLEKSLVLAKSPSTSAAKNKSIKMSKHLEKSKSKTTAAQQPVKKDLKPRSLKMPPPAPIKSITTDAKKPVGAVAKIKTLAQKKTENVKLTRKSPLKSARLAQNMKAKKPLNNKKGNLTALKLNGKKILDIIKSNEPNENMVIQTPRDFATLNPFSEFVTSTKIKESNQNVQIEGIGPSAKKSQGNSSAKRNILEKKDEQNSLKATQQEIHQNVKRFNFIRYSEAKSIDDNGEAEVIAVANENDKTVVEGLDIVDKTPTKCGPEERPPNYLSPFVSVTRGKVSLKKEKEKRNSIYLQNTTDSKSLPCEVDAQNSSKYSLEVRRTLEAVRYFRKQLQDEIDRLHKHCGIWEAYKEENFEKIQNANGEDMINVTIGQTRLLTSKKFMQFKGLIDRCEAGTTGLGDVEYDGSEDTKPITSIDLEGFWSMLGLQIDNLDKRFETLNRWKLNDWIDPDEVKPRKKNNLTKVKKPKAAAAAKSKPNSALQQMLRKKQAEMRKNRDKNDDTNEIVVLTYSKQKHRRSTSSNNSTPRKSLDPNTSHRLSITVKDRKYFSPVATVISFSTNRRASLRRKSSQDSVVVNENSRRTSSCANSPMILMKLKDSENSNDSVDVIKKRVDVLPEENKKEALSQKCFSPYISPVSIGRKSILKTPGTAKSRLRNVIFNEKLRVKKFNFLINDNEQNEEDAYDSHEEDLAKCEDETLKNPSIERILNLRNRRVRLRPSCEIVIPKK